MRTKEKMFHLTSLQAPNFNGQQFVQQDEARNQQSINVRLLHHIPTFDDASMMVNGNLKLTFVSTDSGMYSTSILEPTGLLQTANFRSCHANAGSRLNDHQAAGTSHTRPSSILKESSAKPHREQIRVKLVCASTRCQGLSVSSLKRLNHPHQR